MNKRDYYEVLQVDRNADETTLKKAYRRLAMKYHPDRNPDDAQAEEHFKEAKEAYEILSDAQKRTTYDQFGHAGVNQQAGNGGAGFAGGFHDIFGDVFGDIFGGRAGGRGQRVHRGSDLRYSMELDLEEAVSGCTVPIDIPALSNCETCKGSGARAGSAPATCETCQGNGQVRMQQGFFSIQQTCPKCRGSGKVIKDPCNSCRGQGQIRKNKKLSVKVPAGVDTGDRIRLSGEGESGQRGGPAGDLYVEVAVREHPIFTRQESHLYCEVPISFTAAALGGELDVPTLGGRVKLKIPSETQTGKLFRLRGKGVKHVRGTAPGDLLCRVVLETPINLSRKQKELLLELDVSMSGAQDAHSPRASSWLDGVKRFFEGIKS